MRGKTALVTAASKGIGYAVSKALLRQGCRTIVTSGNAKNTESAVSELAQEFGALVSGFALDLFELTKIQKVLLKELSATPPIDCLILNCPGPRPTMALDASLKDWQESLNVILLSAIEICRVLVPTMASRNFGRVVILASTTAREPDSGFGMSSVGRAALLAFAKTLSRETGRSGITVNSILTGSVKTDRLNELMEVESKALGINVSDYMKKCAEEIPVGYICEPDTFASSVVFLCSENARYITGVAIPVDGGSSRAV